MRFDFPEGHRPVQPIADQDTRIAFGYAALFQSVQHRRQQFWKGRVARQIVYYQNRFPVFLRKSGGKRF